MNRLSVMNDMTIYTCNYVIHSILLKVGNQMLDATFVVIEFTYDVKAPLCHYH